MTVHVMRVRQRFARQVVLLADELVVVQDVELLAGAHLLPTHQAGEAIQVENLVPRLPHEVLRAYPLEAAAAFGAVSPARWKKDINSDLSPDGVDEREDNERVGVS